MTAKFAGKCRNCGGRIEVGEQISWSRELGACHTGTRCQQTPRSTSWLASQPKNIRDGYRLSADERAELNAEHARLLDKIETDLSTEWTRETTIQRRAQFNAAKIKPFEIDRLTGYCERLDVNVTDLKQAIARHGL